MKAHTVEKEGYTVGGGISLCKVSYATFYSNIYTKYRAFLKKKNNLREIPGMKTFPGKENMRVFPGNPVSRDSRP